MTTGGAPGLRDHVNGGMAAPGAIPRLIGDILPLIPTLGLREYWYPALAAREVGGRKPVKVSLLGDDLCLFRGATGDVAAIRDICPHRGARLSEGGRDAPLYEKNPDGLDPDAVPIGRASVRHLQEQAPAEAAASRR